MKDLEKAGLEFAEYALNGAVDILVDPILAIVADRIPGQIDDALIASVKEEAKVLVKAQIDKIDGEKG